MTLIKGKYIFWNFRQHQSTVLDQDQPGLGFGLAFTHHYFYSIYATLHAVVTSEVLQTPTWEYAKESAVFLLIQEVNDLMADNICEISR